MDPSLDAPRIGTATWNLPKEHAARFPSNGSHLERYAARLNAVEINSSFYREHQRKTYERWAESVSEDFQFSVKLSRRFTHEERLQADRAAIAESVAAIHGLGKKFAVCLVQLPPSLGFVPKLAAVFLSFLREALGDVTLALEPRHLSWASERARALCGELGIVKVEADPEPCPWPRELESGESKRSFGYLRLHGSPVLYESDYSSVQLDAIAAHLRAVRGPRWCVFDNTKWGHATRNALDLRARLGLADCPALGASIRPNSPQAAGPPFALVKDR